jgi:ABC-type amino acid transport system permease subunit
VNPSVFGLISFAVIFGGALLGMFAARALPEHHLSKETRSAVTVSAAIVGTLSALVIGLMISTASSSFSTRSSEVAAISVDLIRIDRMMRRYGPEADDVRAKLRTYAVAKMPELFPATGKPSLTSESTAKMMEAMQDALLSLAPTDETHRWLRSQALALSEGLLQARWLLAEQDESSIPMPFLILLIFWLAIVFASFGLFAPLNATAITMLCLCSMAVSGGIAMILELDSPFSGLIRVSAEPMRQALTQIMQ